LQSTPLTCDTLDKKGYTYTKDNDPEPNCYYDTIPTVLCKGYKVGTSYKLEHIPAITLSLNDVQDNIRYIETNCNQFDDDLFKGDAFKNGCYNQYQLALLETAPNETNILPSFECKCTDKDGKNIPFHNCII